MRTLWILALLPVLGAAGQALAGDEDLLAAARQGDLAKVKERLKAGADVNDYEDGYGPLMHAASNGHTKIVRLLLDHGADVEHRDHNTDTALLWAAARAPIEIVKMLLDAGAEVDRATGLRVTPLMRAAREGRADVLRLLIARGADVAHLDHTGGTALHEAVLSRKAEAVGALLAAGADPNVRGRVLRETPLISVAAYGEIGIVRKLVEAKAKLDLRDHHGCTALWRAASCGHAAVVEYLVEHGADPRQESDTFRSPFGVALENGHVAVGRILLEHVTDLDQALRACCESGCLELAKPLVERGARADHRGLLAAAGGGHLELVHLVLATGVTVSATAEDGVTALMRAAAYGRTRVVKVLLETGADRTARDAEGLDVFAHMRRHRQWLRNRILHERRKAGISRELPRLLKEQERVRIHHDEVEVLLRDG